MMIRWIRIPAGTINHTATEEHSSKLQTRLTEQLWRQPIELPIAPPFPAQDTLRTRIDVEMVVLKPHVLKFAGEATSWLDLPVDDLHRIANLDLVFQSYKDVVEREFKSYEPHIPYLALLMRDGETVETAIYTVHR